jgi:C4-dicarboxylate-specific signal transduction histidine kinase
MTAFTRVMLCILAAVAAVALFGIFPDHVARSAGERWGSIGLIVIVSLLQVALVAAVIAQWRRSRRIEQSLAESEERIALAALPRNLGLWKWDAKRNEFWATEHFREILQVPGDLPLDQFSVLEAIHPEDRANFAATLTRPGNGELVASDFRVLQPNGELRWVVGKACAKRDAVGKIERVAGIVLDITERRQAEADSQNQRLQLAHLTRVAMVGQLSGSLAHELTQPLTAILSNAQAAQRVLANERVDLGEVQEILQDIVADDKRAGEVIRRVHTLLRPGETQTQMLDVAQLVRETLTVTRSDLVVRHVQVVCTLPDDLPAVRADGVQIQQVLLNLVLNAAEAMKDNDVHDRRIDITAMRDGQGLRISISDCGPGIAPDQLERVFDAFYSTKREGLGLGLAISRSIISAHGGRLWSTSDGRRGSAFHFTLPG